MRYILISIAYILASKDTQKYFCPAHQNNLGEKYQQIILISITNQGSAVSYVHQTEDVYFGIH